MEQLTLLTTLSELFGPSGCEEAVAEFIKARIAPMADDLTQDQMGNLIALRTAAGAPRGTLMLAAHMDEVGFMITRIEESGFLRFTTVGGIDPRVLPGRHVVLENGVRGVIGCKPIHLQKKDDRTKSIPTKNLYIDIGAKDKESAEKQVEIGAFATFSMEAFAFGGGKKLSGKALDDRAGCALLMELLADLYQRNVRFDYDIAFCFTVREEVGLSGASVVANYLKPDKAIVLETTAIADIAEVDEEQTVAWQGKGGVLSLADRSTIYSEDMIRLALDVGARAQIPVQVKRYLSGGNDAGSIHRSGVGVKCLALSLPTRYLHTATNVIDLADYTSSLALLRALLPELDMTK